MREAMRRLRRFFLSSLLVLGTLVPLGARAQMAPPTWDEVVRDAELIVRARVVEPGRFGARVVAEETFFGEAPEDAFLVIGFNESGFPPPIIELEAMRRDEVVWLFLERWPGFRPEREIPSWLEEGWKPQPGEAFTTGTPIAGDVPLRGGEVHVNLVMAGYHHTAPTLSVERWESLLRALIDRVKHDRIDAAGLERARRCLDEGVASRREMPQGETRESRCLAELWLRGQRTTDPRMADLRLAPDVARGVLAGLAAHAGDPAYDDLIREVALADRPDGALAMITVARGGGEDHIARLLAPLLPAARGSEAPVAGLPLTRLREESTRSRLLALLVDLRSPAVLGILREELRYLNPETLYIGIDAMEQTQAGSWVAPVLPFFERAELRRTTVVLEAMEMHQPASARDALEAFLERDDVDPGLQRMAMRVLGEIGDQDTARMLRERLEAHLAFEGTWSDDRVDLVGAELEALEALTGGEAADLAWIVARQYVGEPRALIDPAFRASLDAERDALHRAVLQGMPRGSTASIQVLFAREEAFESRGARVVLVDAKATGGVSEGLRAEIARRAGTDPERVRLCGPTPGGRVRCLVSRGTFWERHPRLLRPMLLAIGAQAGLGPRHAQPPVPEAGRWMALAAARGWAEELGVGHVVEDLWGPAFQGPWRTEDSPPLIPPGLAPFDPTAPPR